MNKNDICLKVRLISFLILLFISLSQVSNATLVKKSRSGICHNSHSSSYARIKNYRSYDTVEACLQSGGRLPKSRRLSHSSSKLYNVRTSSELSYSRKKFGNGWNDANYNCLNTRQELLKKLSTSTITMKSRCTVSRGKWYDPYTGKTFFDAKKLDIDHIVPLKWAWQHGANHWMRTKCEKFANDVRNLIPVQASANRRKGALGPLRWLPPNTSYRCQYIVRFNRIVKTYGLHLSSRESRGFSQLIAKECKHS